MVKQTTSNIYVISDTHFNHENVIKYCDRPFRDAQDMNDTLIKNWNKIVKNRDYVVFLGDFVLQKGQKGFKHFMNKLNGKILFIKGNHDKTHKVKFYTHWVFSYAGYEIMFIHNPADVPNNWKGWVVHGHCHNNDCKNYPFINIERKTINVCVELIHYTPIKFDKILNVIDYHDAI